MTFRSKFRLSEVHDYGWSGKKYVFVTQYDSSIPEDQRFCKATPNGRLEMIVDNPAVQESFKLGQDYYFDGSAAPTPAK